MRSDEEIHARIEVQKKTDFFGFGVGDLIMRLPFSEAQQYLKDGAPEEDFPQLSRDPDEVRREAIEYMPFAWEKANNGRGLSAGRSLQHFKVWLWLAGFDDEATAHILFDDYEYYGKDELLKICELLGLDGSQWDDGERTNVG